MSHSRRCNASPCWRVGLVLPMDGAATGIARLVIAFRPVAFGKEVSPHVVSLYRKPPPPRFGILSFRVFAIPRMNAHLPADLEQFVQAKVRSGRFSSSDEVISAAVRLLRQQEEAEESRARALEGIRQGLEDVRAGRPSPWPKRSTKSAAT